VANWLCNQWNDIKGNFKYDLVKTLAGGATGGVMISIANALLNKARHLPNDWVQLGAVFAVAFLLLMFLQGRSRRPKNDMYGLNDPTRERIKREDTVFRAPYFYLKTDLENPICQSCAVTHALFNLGPAFPCSDGKERRVCPHNREHVFPPLLPNVSIIDNILNPLQREAFQLSRELREWMKELGPRPTLEKLDGEDNRVYLKRVHPALDEWSNKFTFGYANRFGGKVVNLANRFAEKGARDFELERAQSVTNEDQVTGIINKLRQLALRVED
jgi:hypothetical protein